MIPSGCEWHLLQAVIQPDDNSRLTALISFQRQDIKNLLKFVKPVALRSPYPFRAPEELEMCPRVEHVEQQLIEGWLGHKVLRRLPIHDALLRHSASLVELRKERIQVECFCQSLANKWRRIFLLEKQCQGKNVRNCYVLDWKDAGCVVEAVQEAAQTIGE